MTKQQPLTVAWFSYFPVEWLPAAPPEVQRLSKMHPASWQRVLLGELKDNPDLRLHIVVLRKQFERNLTFNASGATFHLLKAPGGWRAPSLFWVDTWLIRKKLAEIKPDVVHAWGTEQGAALVASRLKYPYVVTMQGLLSWLNELVQLNRYQRFAVRLERWSIPRAPVVTTESTFAVQYLLRHWPRSDVRQVEHAPDWIFHRVERRPQTSPKRFVFIGSVNQTKGADILLLAMDRLCTEFDFEFIVAGGDDRSPFLQTFREKISADLWKRMQFKTNLKPTEVADELARATMMIFPTRADTSPNSVKEAVVAGVPVVASSIGGIVDYVFPGQNGFLFSPGSVDECVNAVRAACAHPLFSAGKVEPATLERVRDYLSPRRMGEGFSEIYKSLKR